MSIQKMKKGFVKSRWFLAGGLTVFLIVMILTGAGNLSARSDGNVNSKPADKEIREITLTARNGKFMLGNRENPTLETTAGKTLRIVFRNTQQGVTHAISIPALSVPNRMVNAGEKTVITVTPSSPGSYKYVCPHHLPIMQGTIRVKKSTGR